jgi:hypothetical protein
MHDVWEFLDPEDRKKYDDAQTQDFVRYTKSLEEVESLKISPRKKGIKKNNKKSLKKNKELEKRDIFSKTAEKVNVEEYLNQLDDKS